MKKAKAYILFYVESTDQVSSDRTSKPHSDKEAMDSVSAEAAPQETDAADLLTHSALMDAAASPHVTSDNARVASVGRDVALLDEADVAPVEDAADIETSEEASQAPQTVAY